MRTVAELQSFLGVKDDGLWGPKSQAALDSILFPSIDKHSVIASVFADTDDLASFNRCKARGKSDEECFKVGDNGIGCWGDFTAQTKIPMCALPPEDMSEKWGSVDAAKHKRVRVTYKDRFVNCQLADRMPHRANITNGAGIDLNPAAIQALQIPKGAMVRVIWEWEP